MVDEGRVAALLQRLRDEVTALRRLAARSDADLFGSEDALPAAKYRLVVAVEAAVDTADHIIASEGLRQATSFADSFRSMEESGWLDHRLAASLQDAARFRNLLVHQYAVVDDTRVLETIRTRLDDLDDFATMIADQVS